MYIRIMFFFTKQCYLQLFVESSCLIYVICICLRIVLSKTYCVLFLVCFSSCCVPVSVSLDCPFLIVPSVFSNAYLVSEHFHWYITIYNLIIARSDAQSYFLNMHIFFQIVLQAYHKKDKGI